MHVVIFPLTGVSSTVLPFVDSLTFDAVLEPVTVVTRAILPNVEATTMLLSFMIATLIFRVVGPDLLAFAVLQIVLPLALVAGTVLMYIDTPAVSLVIEPFAFKDITIDVPEFTVTAGLVESPMALVFGTVLPDLNAVAMLHVSEPVTGVSGTVFEVNFSTLLKLRFIDVLHVKVGILLIFKAIIAAGVVLVMRV
jgi:hypothetical protein